MVVICLFLMHFVLYIGLMSNDASWRENSICICFINLIGLNALQMLKKTNSTVDCLFQSIVCIVDRFSFEVSEQSQPCRIAALWLAAAHSHTCCYSSSTHTHSNLQHKVLCQAHSVQSVNKSKSHGLHTDTLFARKPKDLVQKLAVPKVVLRAGPSES